jgi:hypothetical protein
VKLDKTSFSIDSLLDLMERQEPQAIHLNHVVVEDDMADMPFYATLEHVPMFTVNLGGFVEIEISMDTRHSTVLRMSIRQSAMSFEDLNKNGDVLPNLTVNCKVLKVPERRRLDAIASEYITKSKILDKNRCESLLTQFVGKAMFCPVKYGEMSRA